jgi:hypothetical protein
MAHLSDDKTVAKMGHPVSFRLVYKVISSTYIMEDAMRTLVDIPGDELEELNSLSRSRKVSRAELIRQAVAGFLAENRAGLEDSFGIWKKRGMDGVKYQEKLRGEWER